MFIWRPVIRGVVTYSEVSNLMSLMELVKVNALLDMQDYLSQIEYDKIKG